MIKLNSAKIRASGGNGGLWKIILLERVNVPNLAICTHCSIRYSIRCHLCDSCHSATYAYQRRIDPFRVTLVAKAYVLTLLLRTFARPVVSFPKPTRCTAFYRFRLQLLVRLPKPTKVLRSEVNALLYVIGRINKKKTQRRASLSKRRQTEERFRR